MARRSRMTTETAKADLFPFLSVLICLMGVMVLILFMVIDIAENNKKNKEKNFAAEMQKTIDNAEAYKRKIEMVKNYDPDEFRLMETQIEKEVELQTSLASKNVDEIRAERELAIAQAEKAKEREAINVARLTDLKDSLSKEESTIELTTQQLAQLKAIVDLSASITTTGKKEEELSSQLELAKLGIAKLKKQFNNLGEEKKKIEAQLAGHNASVEKLRLERERSLKQINTLKKKLDHVTLSLPSETLGKKLVPGVGEPVKTDYNLVYMLCDADGIWLIPDNGVKRPVNVDNALDVVKLREQLASDPNLLLYFLVKAGGEKNFQSAVSAFRGLRTSKYPVAADWQPVVASKDEKG